MENSELIVDGPEASRLSLVLAHGAGAAMDSPFMVHVAEGLAVEGLRVVRFEFPYMEARRRGGGKRAPDREPVLLECWRAVLEHLGGGACLWVGGKSLGGRMASLVADDVGARGLVCLGYPFHPPGRPDKTRTRHLETIRTPTLIVQGTRDPFGKPEEVAGYRLARGVQVHWLEAGNHSFKPPARSGRTEAENLAEAVAVVARFVKETAAR